MRELQKQHKLWADKRFPKQPPEVPAAGMVEEAGELLHAILALYRERRWGADPRYPTEKLFADFTDAIGDCSIYACSYCNAADWDFGAFEAAPVAIMDRSDLALGVDLVRIAAEFFCTSSASMLMLYMGTLTCIAAKADMDLMEVTRTVWQEVRKR